MPTDNSNAFSPQDLTRTEDQNRVFPNARGQVVPAIESAPEEPQDWKTPMAEPEGGWQQEGTPLTIQARPKEVNKILNSKHVLSDLDTSDSSNARVFVANFLNSKYDEDKRGIYKDYEGKTKAYGLSGDPVADAKSILDGDTKTHESSQTRIAKDREVIAEGLDKLGYEERQGFGANVKSTFDRGFLDLGIGTAAQGTLKGIESMGDEMERIERGLFEDMGITYYDEELGDPVTSEDVQKWREDVRERNEVDPEFLNSYTGGIIQGYGQAAAIVPAFLLNPLLGTGMSISQAYQYGEDAYRDFVKSEGITYDEAEARKAGLWNMPSAAVDVIANRFVVGKILKPLKGAKVTKGGALEFIKDTAESAVAGSGTEGAQTVWENLNAKYLSGYDRDRVLTDGVVDAMIIGAFVDSTITAGGQSVTKGINKLLGKTMDPIEGMSAVDMALAQNVVPEAEFNAYTEELYGDQTTEEGVPLKELAQKARQGDRKAAEQLVEAVTVEASRGAVEAGLTPAEAEARGKEAAEVADPVEPLVETPIDKEISAKKEELAALEGAEDSTPEDMKRYEKLDKEIQALEAKRVEEIVKGKIMTPFTRGVEAEKQRIEQARLDEADRELEEQDQVIDLINILSPLSVNTTVENMPELAAGGKAIIQGWKDAGFTKKEIEAKSKELMTAQGMPNTRLEDVVQKGSQKSTKTDGGPIQSLIKLFKGANPFTVVEEFAHAEYDRDIANGTITVEQVRAWRKAVEELTGTPDLRGETDEDVKEWVAEQVKARIYGQRNNLSLPESFLKFLDNIISKFKQILGRAKELQDLEASGQLPAGFLEMLDRQGLVGKPQQPLGPETESGTAGPDTPVESLDGEGPEIEWKADESFSIEVDRDSYPTITPEIFDTIKGETDTLGVIHIDRMIAGGDYEGVLLQGGMFYPSITENLENNVVWAFNSINVANDVIDRARKNGGYLQLVLMNEGNVVGNKTFTTIWFNELNKSIAEGRTTKTKALKFLNDQREAASKLKTKIPFRHTKKWKSVAEASEAIISMPQLARGVFYSSRSSADTKARGKHVTYGKMLSAKASKALGLPSTESLVEKLEEPAFKGLPSDSIVAVIKIDTDQPAMSAQEAGVTPHLSYGYVVKGKPVAKMKKAPVLTDAFPHLKGKLMSAGQFQSPASLLEEESYSLEVEESMKDVTKRTPEVVEAAAQYGAGKITLDEYNEIVAKADPIEPFTEVPAAATEEETIGALKKDKVPFVGTENFTRKLTSGDRVGARLDIPAYRDYGVWVASVHEPRSGVSSGGAGAKIGYVPTVRLSNVNFATNPFVAFRIATGQAAKNTIATVEGDWVEQSDGMSETEAKDVLNDPSWVQVGMNPFRHSYFYDRSRNTGAPVVSAEEVIQVGGLVLAKNPVYAPKNDPRFKIMQGKIKPAALEKAGVTDLDATFSLEKSPTSLRLKMTRKQIIESIEGSKDWKDFYTRSKELMVEYFGADAPLFERLLSATSQAASVKANVSLALKAYGQLKRGDKFTGYLPAVIGNLNKISKDEKLSGRKISNYENANAGDVTKVVVDRHVARMLFGTKSPTAKQFSKAEKVLTEVANDIGWEPRQVQAAIWAASIRKSNLEPESYDGYLKRLKREGTLEQKVGFSFLERSAENIGSGDGRPDTRQSAREAFSLEPLSEQDADAEATVAAEERQSRTPERQAFIDYQRELRRTQLDNTEEEKEKLQRLLQLATDADEIESLKQAGDEKIIRVVEQKVKQIRKQAAEREDVTESVKALERLINSPEVPMEVRARMRGFGRLVERKTPQGKARWVEQMANKLEAEIDRHYRTRNVRTLRSLLRPFSTEYAPNRRKLRERVGEEARADLNFAQRLLNNSEATPPEGMADERRDELIDIFGDVGNRQSNPTRVKAALEIAGSIAKGGRTSRDEFKEDRRQRNEQVGDLVREEVLSGEQAMGKSQIAAREKQRGRLRRGFDYIRSRLIRGMEGFQQQLNKMDSVKGGILEDLFLPAVYQADQNEKALNREHVERVNEDFKTVLGTDDKVAASWYENSHELHDTDIEWIEDKAIGMEKRTISKQQGVALFMQWLDPSLRSTFSNMGINESTIEQVKEFIGEIGVSEAYYFRERYAEMGIRLNAKHMEVEGIPLDMIDGYGGRARRINSVGSRQEDMQMFSTNASGRPTVKSGSMKERTNSTDYLIFRDASADFSAHAKEVNHYISHAELAKNLSAAFLNNARARNAITQKHGADFYESLKDQVEAIIEGDPKITNKTDRDWNRIRSNVTKAQLMAKPAILIKQLTSAPAFVEEIGPVAYAKAAASLTRNARKFMPMIWNSEYVKNRMSNSQFADIQQQLDQRDNTLKGLRWDDYAMMNVKWGDIGAVIAGGAPVYVHAYNEAKAAGMTNDQAQVKAEEVFGLASERAQQSSATHAKGAFLRGKGAARTWFMYLTSPLQYQRNVNTGIANLVANVFEKKAGRKSDVKKAANQALRAIVIYHVLLPQIFQAVASGLVGFTDDEDYIKEQFWAKQRRALYAGNLNAIPLAGQLITVLANLAAGTGESWDSSGSPIIDLVGEIKQDFEKAVKNGDDLSAWLELSSSAGLAAGIPVKTINNYYDAITDISEGNTEHPFLRAGGWSKWSIFED